MNQHRRLYFSLFIIICFLLALLSSQNSTIRWLDAQMFHLASYLLPAQSTSNSLRIIQLDESHLQTPQGIQSFRSLLRKLNHASAAEIVWLSEDIPQMDYVDNKKSTKDKTNKTLEDEEQQWMPTKGERNKLAWMLENQKVFLTQYNNVPEKQNYIDYKETLIFKTTWRQYIPDLFLPQAAKYRLSNKQLPYRVYPFNDQRNNQQTLIWYNETKTSSLPDLSVALFSQYNKNNQLHWNENGKIDFGLDKLNASLSGKVYSYFSDISGRHTAINLLSLDNAIKKPNLYYKQKIVLIGQNSQQLQALADAVSNLDAGGIYYTPVISWWLLPLLMAVVAVYLLWALPFLSKQSGLFLGAFVLLSIITVQPILLILKAEWWPIINILLLILIGHIIAYIYKSGHDLLEDLSRKQLEACYQLGHYQYEKGDYEVAISSLLKCHNRKEALDDLYEIALSFERKRQYDRALQVYSEINIRDKQYKDVEKRIVSMSGFSQTVTQIRVPTDAQKTIVMPELELPEFGRYKISKELVRGAMGVVYLGKDPKINRSVAIKTLDYTQFSKNELKTLKARFFREAEAAGRLSHSNIVTVYDVGEEDGFAFIAMDYVNGLPLSDYTQPEKLLPIHEVYRIIQIVAEALDYAHQQNIVHRDIKPANIMYNLEDQQIKITDFGIARITDSVKTRTGSFMGSPSYMAPEQMTGAHVGGQADIYSLGVSFYQLLTGSLPFDADSLGNLAYKITNEDHIPIRNVRSELPTSASRIINKALQKKASKRYATGAEMAAAIKRGMPNA